MVIRDASQPNLCFKFFVLINPKLKTNKIQYNLINPLKQKICINYIKTHYNVSSV